MRKLRFDFSLCAVIEVIFVFLIVVGTVVQNDALISLCFAASFLVLIFYLLVRNTRFDLLTLLLVVLAVICVLINSAISPEMMLGFSYFKKLFMFIAFCILFLFSSEDGMSRQAWKAITRIPVFAALLLVVSYYSGMNTEKLGNMLMLGFSNPNFTGMWLLHLFIYVFLNAIDKRENGPMRLMSIVLLPVLANLIFLTYARSCLVGFVAFWLLCCYFFLDRHVRTRKWVTALVLLFPLLFAYAYPSLLNSEWFNNMFEFVSSEGKGLNARLDVWLPALDAIEKNPLWGDYSGISDGTGVSQMHNMHLDVFASYGAIVGVLFLALMLKRTLRLAEGAKNGYQRCALSGWLAIVVASTFEGAVVAGAMGMNILTALLLALMRWTPENDNRGMSPGMMLRW